MPTKPKRPCRYPRCPNFCEPGQVYCKVHSEYSSDRQRGNASDRGYNREWQKERLRFLHEHPFCVMCLKEKGQYVKATVVDHIRPHRGDKTLFWDRSNWQPLCERHHNEKTGHGL